ncbi:MAG: ATP-dependent DNA ligase [Planctomycetota bacterium]|jgi:DNA ligase-1
MLLKEIVDTSAALRKTRSRRQKSERLATCLRRLESRETISGVAYLCGVLPSGRIGVGPARIRQACRQPAAESATLTLLDVHCGLDHVAQISGAGSSHERERQLGQLFGRATAAEQDFLARLLLGELRQGASEGLVAEAIAEATSLSTAEVRRAIMFSGNDLGAVAAAALADGRQGLARFTIELFRPVLPMLAQPADDFAGVFERLSEAGLEFKLDGARIQVHKGGDEVRVFTRRLNDVTEAVPEIVDVARALPTREVILDGEALALRPEGQPHPFQITMKRFGRRLDVAEVRRQLPLSCFFFDCLYLDGESLVDRPGRQRMQAMEPLVLRDLAVPRVVTADPARAEQFWNEALRQGHEGLMAKSLEATYEAGGRGYSWLKLKPAHTLDLVVLAAEWGSGRRRGWLSNLHLGARDPLAGGFVMLGKTFKGLTDKLLAWQTKRLLELELSRDAYTVYVRPQLVVEIAFSGVQASPHYPGGLALRFARVKRYRPDKRAEDADTIDAVGAIFEKR